MIKKALVQLHLAIFLYGFTSVLGKMITLQIGPMLIWRLLFAIAFLWVMALIYKTYKLDNYSILLPVCGLGFLMTLHWLFFYGSVKVSTVSNALVAFSTISLFTAILEPWLTKRKLNWFEVSLGVISFIGVLIIFQSNFSYRLGIIYGVIGAILGSVFAVYNKKLLESIAPKKLSLYLLSSVFVYLIILFPLFELLFPSTTYIPNWRDLILILIFSSICTIWTFELMFNAQSKVSAFTVSITFNLEPIYGILLAFIFLKENKLWSVNFLIGFSLVSLSSILQMIRLVKPKYLTLNTK